MMAGIVRVLSRTLNKAALPARVAGSAEEVASSQPAGATIIRTRQHAARAGHHPRSCAIGLEALCQPCVVHPSHSPAWVRHRVDGGGGSRA